MGRPYTAAEFRERVTRALEGLPGLCLGFDVIVGFPGEDAAAFGETVSLLESLPLAYLHVFPFSPRRGTRAHALPDRVAEGEIKARARALRELSAEKRRAYHAAHLGRELPALAEGEPAAGELRLRTRNYIPVRVPWEGAPPGDELTVRLERLAGDHVKGRTQSAATGSEPWT